MVGTPSFPTTTREYRTPLTKYRLFPDSFVHRKVRTGLSVVNEGRVGTVTVLERDQGRGSTEVRKNVDNTPLSTSSRTLLTFERYID